MTYSESDKIKIQTLLTVLDAVCAAILATGNSPSNYRALNKALNILRNCDPKGMRHIHQHLHSAFHVIYDNIHITPELTSLMNKAYAIAENDSLFNKALN